MNGELFEELTAFGRNPPEKIRLILDDGREIPAEIVSVSIEPYEAYSNGVVDIAVEFEKSVFKAHDDFLSDVGYVYQLQTGSQEYTKPVLNVWDIRDEKTKEMKVGTITDVEQVTND